MGLFDNVIIVSDIDGTFLGKNGRLVPENLEKIRWFQENGGRFTIATGREHFLVYPSVPQVDDICNFPAVVCNGAYIYDFAAHRTVEEAFLDDGPLIPLIRAAADACPRAAFRVDAQGCLFVERCHELLGWVKAIYPDRIRVMPLEAMPRGCWHKVAFDGPPDEIDRAEAMLAGLDGRFVRIRSGADIVEIQSAASTKGTMLRRVREMGGADAVVWAVGDYENDYAMLTAADRCAVPENAIDKLKAIHGVVRLCDCDKGAIADLIDRIEEELKS